MLRDVQEQRFAINENRGVGLGWARVELEDGAVRRLDLVALGAFHGEGRWTGGAPPGEFELGVALTLAGANEGSRAALGIPPQGSRDLADYLGQR